MPDRMNFTPTSSADLDGVHIRVTSRDAVTNDVAVTLTTLDGVRLTRGDRQYTLAIEDGDIVLVRVG